jgi:prevent-host-death family protein
MPSIGIRELRDKLSLYLTQVKEGKQIEITNRGEVIALLSPVRRTLDKELLLLLEEGMASWAGGKPKGSTHSVPCRGRQLSDLIIEDRR